ncbi:18S rRNA (guanine-N(7))-methyltransferase-like [Temnothorax longispinosus]|uniref:18S rRNA (guanine-N(7))-methyltransferase-like n=1 Tax=Temnothorax longispinosus TaxID=300112 RepID=UPI003A994603
MVKRSDKAGQKMMMSKKEDKVTDKNKGKKDKTDTNTGNTEMLMETDQEGSRNKDEMQLVNNVLTDGRESEERENNDGRESDKSESNGNYTFREIIYVNIKDVAVDERELDGDLILGDIGQGLPFKAGTFDGAISISALQWLCYASKTLHNPTKRLYRFFSTLYACLSRSARAVLQFYPENGEQVELITAQATKAGFYGGVVVDFPNSAKAKKMVLVLMTGGAAPLPKALGVENENRPTVANSRREYIKKAKGKSLKKSRDWILEKKERRRRQEKEVRDDSKYTGRKRPGRF